MAHRNKYFKLTIMGEKAKKSRLTKIPAWKLSLFTLIVFLILGFILEDAKSSSLSTFQIVGYTFCVIFIAIACFIICRSHPKSVWYTPVICNVLGIPAIPMYFFTDEVALSELMFWVISNRSKLRGKIRPT